MIVMGMGVVFVSKMFDSIHSCFSIYRSVFFTDLEVL